MIMSYLLVYLSIYMCINWILNNEHYQCMDAFFKEFTDSELISLKRDCKWSECTKQFKHFITRLKGQNRNLNDNVLTCR